MSYRASHWAKTVRTGHPTKKAVLLAMAEETDHFGWCWSGIEAIAEYAEISERQVQRIVRVLADQRFVAVFQTREKDGRLRNLYRLNFKAKPADSMPEGHPSQSGRYRLKYGLSIDDPDFALPGDNMSPGSTPETAEFCGEGAESDEAGTGDNLSPGGHTTPEVEPYDTGGHPIRHQMSHIPVTVPVTDPGAPGRARDPDGAARPVAPDGGDGGDSTGDGEADQEPPKPPVNALWREREAAIRAKLGADFDRWLGDAIPDADDGDVYTLALPSPFTADMVNRQFSRTLAGLLGRREVRAEFHPYAKVAAHNRKQAGGAG